MKSQQVGAKGMIYVKCNEDGTYKSSVDKFFDQDALAAWAEKAGAEKGDLLLVLSGDLKATRNQMGVLRLEMGDKMILLGIRMIILSVKLELYY